MCTTRDGSQGCGNEVLRLPMSPLIPEQNCDVAMSIVENYESYMTYTNVTEVLKIIYPRNAKLIYWM